MNESDFVIIGGGPGGVAAATSAARAGANVTLLDENERLGGGKIEAILETGDITKNWLQGLKGIWGDWDFLKEGRRYFRSIRKSRVPLDALNLSRFYQNK